MKSLRLAGSGDSNMRIFNRLIGAMTLSLTILLTGSTVFSQAEQSQAPSQSFELKNISVDYDLKQDGEIGMRIRLDLNAQGYRNKEVYLRLTFLDEMEEPLEDTDGRYQIDGTVALERKVRPTKNVDQFKDLALFMPYDGIETRESGESNLLIDIDIVDSLGELIQHLDFHEFVFDDGKSPVAPLPAEGGVSGVLSEVTITHGVERESMPGMLVKFTVDQVVGLKGVDAFITLRFLESVEEEEYVQSAIPRYADGNGDLIITSPINAGFDPAKFSDVEMFVPYSAFSLEKGTHTVEMDIDILASKPKEVFLHLGYKTVTVTKK